MTEQTALEWLKVLNLWSTLRDEPKEACELAIKALEKQIPKHPVYSDFDDNGYEEIIPYKAVCPTCGHEFEFGTWNNEQNHHCECGQHLNWSEV